MNKRLAILLGGLLLTPTVAVSHPSDAKCAPERIREKQEQDVRDSTTLTVMIEVSGDKAKEVMAIMPPYEEEYTKIVVYDVGLRDKYYFTIYHNNCYAVHTWISGATLNRIKGMIKNIKNSEI